MPIKCSPPSKISIDSLISWRMSTSHFSSGCIAAFSMVLTSRRSSCSRLFSASPTHVFSVRKCLSRSSLLTLLLSITLQNCDKNNFNITLKRILSMIIDSATNQNMQFVIWEKKPTLSLCHI